jgi:hypothetical protein
MPKTKHQGCIVLPPSVPVHVLSAWLLTSYSFQAGAFSLTEYLYLNQRFTYYQDFSFLQFFTTWSWVVELCIYFICLTFCIYFICLTFCIYFICLIGYISSFKLESFYLAGYIYIYMYHASLYSFMLNWCLWYFMKFLFSWIIFVVYIIVLLLLSYRFLSIFKLLSFYTSLSIFIKWLINLIGQELCNKP